MANEQGILGLFRTPSHLIGAIHKMNELNISKMEAFTPFPIHEVISALKIRRSRLPWVTFFMGILGMMAGFSLQAWTMGIDWPLNIGGKPYISWPAFIPITFELMVLIGGLSTVAALFYICGFPNRKNLPLDFRLTDDRFGLFVESSDINFNESQIQKIFKECHVDEVKLIS